MNHLGEGKGNHNQIGKENMKHQDYIMGGVRNFFRYHWFEGKKTAEIGTVIFNLNIKSSHPVAGSQMHVATENDGQEKQ